MGTFDELEALLRGLPRFEPNPSWKERTKLRLLSQLDPAHGTMEDVHHWAIFATYDQDPVDFAAWVRAKGRDWRAVAVSPERLDSAVANLQPNLVVIDSHVPRHDALARMVRARSAAETAVASQQELAHIA